MVKKSLIMSIVLLVCVLTAAQAQTEGEGIIVPGDSLAEKLTWLQRSADSHNTYILIVNANENIATYTFEYKGVVNVTVILKGNDVSPIIRLRSNDQMFIVRSNVTFILENITLQGHRRDRGTMVWIQEGGMFIMNEGSAIIGNTETASDRQGAGVYVDTRGAFVMNGGTISGNTASNGGGGVFVAGTFTMNGGSISENTAPNGGGVHIASGGTFNLNNGSISKNTASNGGGVYRANRGNFAMRDGTITANTAKEYGGGVYAHGSSGSFTKAGGSITGYNSDQSEGNVVKDDAGVLARRGHAVYVDENRRKEITAGPDDRLNSKQTGAAGGWDN
jgi:hypothetical protein